RRDAPHTAADRDPPTPAGSATTCSSASSRCRACTPGSSGWHCRRLQLILDLLLNAAARGEIRAEAAVPVLARTGPALILHHTLLCASPAPAPATKTPPPGSPPPRRRPPPR